MPSDSLSREQLAELLIEGSFRYYQGSTAHQLLLQEVLKIDPNSALAHREMGVAYLKRGIADQFPRYYSRAADLDPLSWLGWRGYIYLYFYRDYYRAIQDFDTLDPLTPSIVDHPQSTSIEYMRGLAYHQLGDYAVARSYIDRHIAFEAEQASGPRYTSPETWLLSALNYRALGRDSMALAQLDYGLQWPNRPADLHYYRAVILEENGELEAAFDALQAAFRAYERGYYLQRPYVTPFFKVWPEDMQALKHRLKGN